jgi:hypothetical protein
VLKILLEGLTSFTLERAIKMTIDLKEELDQCIQELRINVDETF